MDTGSAGRGSSARFAGNGNGGTPTSTQVVTFATLLAAATSDTLPGGSTFEAGDGNLVPEGNIDWKSFTGSPAGFTFTRAIDRPSNDDNIFTQGPRENDPSPATQIANNTTSKANLLRAYVASETCNSSTFMYLAWVRLADSGDGSDPPRSRMSPDPPMGS